MSRAARRIPAWLWLWAGPAMVVAQVATKAVGEPVYRRWMRGELGLVENLTVVFLLGGVVCALLAFGARARVRWRLFGPAVLAVAAGLAFFAGEKASWGQHWFGFQLPASLVERNDQGEFDLHDEPLFQKLRDQLPRVLLTLTALVVGVIAPLVRRARRRRERDFASPRPWDWVWPGLETFPAAILALTVTLPEKVFDALDRPVPYLLEIRAGETKEYCLALFLFVYLLGLVLDLRFSGKQERD